jgi:hypothetical protein
MRRLKMMRVNSSIPFADMNIQDILSAMCKLESPQDIQQFVTEYENWFVMNADDTVKKGTELEVARKNIGYILGYLDAENRNRMYSALSNISHPVFGSSFGRN